MKYLLFTMLFYPIILLAQNGQIHGTLVIAAIGSDGIIVASDSRAAIVGENNVKVAYKDSACKITLLNGFPLAISGSSLVGKKFATGLVSDFNMIYPKSNDVQQTFIDFKQYMISHSPDTLHQMFIGAGYFNNVGYTFEFSNKSQSASNNGFVFNENDFSDYLREYVNVTLTCAQLIEILPKLIYKYAKDKHKEDVIGGAISIVKISDGNKVTWIQNNFIDMQPYDYKSFLELIKSGKIKLTPLVDNGINLAIRAIEWRLSQ